MGETGRPRDQRLDISICNRSRCATRTGAMSLTAGILVMSSPGWARGGPDPVDSSCMLRAPLGPDGVRTKAGSVTVRIIRSCSRSVEDLREHSKTVLLGRMEAQPHVENGKLSRTARGNAHHETTISPEMRREGGREGGVPAGRPRDQRQVIVMDAAVDVLLALVGCPASSRALLQ